MSKPIRWLHGTVKTPPFSEGARIETGIRLRDLQEGVGLAMPFVRPMPEIGARCYELRVRDAQRNWRIMYRLDADAVVVAEVFNKTTRTTPQAVIDACKQRLASYDEIRRRG